MFGSEPPEDRRSSGGGSGGSGGSGGTGGEAEDAAAAATAPAGPPPLSRAALGEGMPLRRRLSYAAKAVLAYSHWYPGLPGLDLGHSCMDDRDGERREGEGCTRPVGPTAAPAVAAEELDGLFGSDSDSD